MKSYYTFFFYLNTKIFYIFCLHKIIYIFTIFRHDKPLNRFRELTKGRFATGCSELESIQVYSAFTLGKISELIYPYLTHQLIPRCQALYVPPTLGSVQFNDSRFIDFVHSLSKDIVFTGINERDSIIQSFNLPIDGIMTDRIDLAPQIMVDLSIKTQAELQAQKDSIPYLIRSYLPSSSPDEHYDCASLLCHFIQSSPSLNFFYLLSAVILIITNSTFLFIYYILSLSYKILTHKNPSTSSSSLPQSQPNSAPKSKQPASENQPKSSKPNESAKQSTPKKELDITKNTNGEKIPVASQISKVVKKNKSK